MQTIGRYLGYLALCITGPTIAYTIVFVILEHGVGLTDQDRMAQLSRRAGDAALVMLGYLAVVRKWIWAK